ncbi:MAG: N-acetylmuramoyl-L-alanine amidase [Actinomycetota bacterium]|nr:N-acetylmuramoyl-L-alanine amidase [Actinomycetota bacterium]
MAIVDSVPLDASPRAMLISAGSINDRIHIATRWVLVVVLVASAIVLGSGPADARRVHETLGDTRPVGVGPIETDFPIDYVAIQWGATDRDMDLHSHGSAESHGAVRFRHDGRWGSWSPFAQDGAEAPEQWTSGLIPAGDAEAYQVRGVPAWADAPSVAAINTTDGPLITIGTRPGGAADALSNCVSRAEWGADESYRYVDGDIDGAEAWPPSFYPVQTLTVHHTADWNGQDPVGLVQATYYNHAVHNGWGDIAYNYLIDEQGLIYEGRWSGSESTPCSGGGDGSDFAHDEAGALASGGHTKYHNQGNVGIALLGIFADETEFDYPPTIEPVGPTEGAVSSLEGVLAELAARHDLDPLGTVDYDNPVSDAAQTVDTISGHRDWKATACPGAFLYAQLPDIRQAVHERLDRPLITVSIDPLVLEGNTIGGYSGELSGVRANNPIEGTVSLSNDAPDLLPLGETLVTWTAVSTGGSTAAATQTVRVADTTPPTVSVPGDMFVQSVNGGGSTVNYTATSIDIVDPRPTVACKPPSASLFPLGSTTVSCVATDASGNATEAAFAVVVFDPDPFTDDDESIFEADIAWMAAMGITKGCNPPANTRFCPDANVTREQMAAFLTRALDLTERLNDPFADDDDSIFEADIERLAAAGITKGCNPPANTRFCPDANVTREQMAAFLVRALGYSDNGGGDLFTDDDGSIFEGDIDRLGTAGVTKGCNPPSNTRFCPGSRVTRGQMAAFLHRALG